MVATAEVYMEKSEREANNWIRKHLDTITIVTAVVGAALWMNSSMNSLEMRLGNRIGNVEKDIAIIKTVLVMKGMLPPEMASAEKK